MKLLTLEEYNKLSAYEQGYACYMQASWPGSEIPDKCPHPDGSKEAEKWTDGGLAACLAVQDSEE